MPSIAAQTNQNFKWLVFIDHETNPKFVRILEKYQQEYPFIAVNTVAHALQHQAITENADPNKPFDYLITSRVDCDDGLARNYVGLVQNQFREQKLEFIDFPHGFQKQYKSPECCTCEYHYNMFQSLIVDRREQTVLVTDCQHTKTAAVGPVVSVVTDPAWLMVIHDHNLSNRMRGKPQYDHRLLELFSIRDCP